MSSASLLGVASLLLLPAVCVKERACSPREVLGADVHVGVLDLIMVVLVGVRQVPYSNSNANWDGCTEQDPENQNQNEAK